MQGSFSIRPLVEDDIPAISEIYGYAVENRQTAHTQLPPPEYWKKWFHDRSAHFPAYILLEEGKVAGFASVSPYREGRQALEKVAEISYYLHPHHQRRGGGTYLLRQIIQLTSAIGFNHLVAILLGSNDASIRLLEKAGFKRWGQMPGIAEFKEGFTDHLYFGRQLEKKFFLATPTRCCPEKG